MTLNETFITKAKSIHGDRYNYELVEYKNSKTKIKIICKKHGSFQQTPSKHLSKSGCPICGNEAKNKARVATAKSEFEEKASIIHNSKYSYELVDYKTNKIKVSISCPIHGIFEQQPDNHLGGQGCPICSAEESSTYKRTRAAESFIEKANLKHNNNYDYSLVKYKGAHTKVSIICPIHGVFEQAASGHLSGKGCSLCAREESGWTRTKFKEKCDKNNNGLGILYIIECFNENERFFKIGITSRSTLLRYNSSTKMPYLFSIVKEVIGDPIEIYNLEIKLHQLNKENKYIPSIPFGGHATECFKEYKEK